MSPTPFANFSACPSSNQALRIGAACSEVRMAARTQITCRCFMATLEDRQKKQSKKKKITVQLCGELSYYMQSPLPFLGLSDHMILESSTHAREMVLAPAPAARAYARAGTLKCKKKNSKCKSSSSLRSYAVQQGPFSALLAHEPFTPQIPLE